MGGSHTSFLWEPLQRRPRGSGPVLGKHPIAAEAAPTVTTPTLGHSGSVARERCSPFNSPQCPEEPAGTTLGAGSRRRGQRVEKARRGPARDGRPFPLRQDVESETSTRSPTRPEGQ